MDSLEDRTVETDNPRYFGTVAVTDIGARWATKIRPSKDGTDKDDPIQIVNSGKSDSVKLAFAAIYRDLKSRGLTPKRKPGDPVEEPEDVKKQTESVDKPVQLELPDIPE